MSSLSEFLRKDKKLQEMDEPSPPNAERRGLWRILAVSMIGAVIGLGLVAAVALLLRAT